MLLPLLSGQSGQILHILKVDLKMGVTKFNVQLFTVQF